MPVNGKYGPLCFFLCLAHASLYRNVPVLYRFKDELQLVGIQVFLFRLLSTFPELDDFHIGCIVAVGVFYETGRPAAGNVVEEQAGKVGRPFECLACPFGGEVHLRPRGQLGGDSVQRIPLEVVATVPYQSLLVKETSAQHVGDFVITSTDVHIVFV